jgi:predicted nuclease of predicted toxin-antitoxin system
MKIKLDENLPGALALLLKNLGHDTQTVNDEHLRGSEDSAIWDAVQNEQRFLITQDLGFSDARRFTPGTHYGILLVRLRQPSRANLLDRVGEIFRSESVEQWLGCFVYRHGAKSAGGTSITGRWLSSFSDRRKHFCDSKGAENQKRPGIFRPASPGSPPATFFI